MVLLNFSVIFYYTQKLFIRLFIQQKLNKKNFLQNIYKFYKLFSIFYTFYNYTKCHDENINSSALLNTAKYLYQVNFNKYKKFYFRPMELVICS